MKATIELDESVMAQLERLRKEQGTSLSQLIADLLNQALKQRPVPDENDHAPRWISREMHARVDIADRDAVWAAMER